MTGDLRRPKSDELASKAPIPKMATFAPVSSRARARPSNSGRPSGDQRFVSSGTRRGKGTGWGGPASGLPATGAGWGPPKGKGNGKHRSDATMLTPGCNAEKRQRAAAVRDARWKEIEPLVQTLMDLALSSQCGWIALWAADRVLTLLEGAPRRTE